MVVKTHSFLQDALIRNEKGTPQGRAVLVSRAGYYDGIERLNVAVISVLKLYCSTILGFEFYIDGNRYRIPESLPEVKLQKNNKEWIVTNFILERA